MLKLLHTADWQLGASSPLLGEAAASVAQERFETARRIAQIAQDQAVDLVLLAGDTFEHPDVDDSVVRAGVDVLNAFSPIPTLVLPGNHDPLVPGSVWDRRSFLSRLGDHVTVIEREEVLHPCPDVSVWPCPLRQKQSRRDPTEWIPVRSAEESGFRIGLAHGSIDTLAKKGNFPIRADRAATSELDYLALGDWHGLKRYERAAYPGTPEATSFAEKDPGHVLIVGLEGDAPPNLDAVSVGRMSWLDLRREFDSVEAVERLADELASREELDRLVLRLRLEPVAGAVEEATRALVERLEQDARFVDAWVAPTVDGRAPLPVGLLSEVDALLGGSGRAGSGRAGSGESATGRGADPVMSSAGESAFAVALAEAEPEVVQEARRRLRLLAERFGS